MSRALHVTISPSLVVARRAGESTDSWSCPVGEPTPEGVRAALAALAEAAAPTRGTRADVVLQEPLIQRRTLAGLPPLRRTHLRDLVQQQHGRFFRRNGSPLITDACWVRNGEGPPVALAVAADASWLEAVADGLHHAGLTLGRLGPPDADLELIPADVRAQRAARERRSTLQAAATALCLWLLVGGLFVGRLWREHAVIVARVAELREPTAALAVTRRDVERVSAMISAIDVGRRSQSRVAQMLISALRRLPAGAWLRSAAIRSNGEVELQGWALRPQEVVASLERVGFRVVRVKTDNGVPEPGVSGFTIQLEARDAERP